MPPIIQPPSTMYIVPLQFNSPMYVLYSPISTIESFYLTINISYKKLFFLSIHYNVGYALLMRIVQYIVMYLTAFQWFFIFQNCKVSTLKMKRVSINPGTRVKFIPYNPIATSLVNRYPNTQIDSPSHTVSHTDLSHAMAPLSQNLLGNSKLYTFTFNESPFQWAR